jgi:protein-disulfide isomerase
MRTDFGSVVHKLRMWLDVVATLAIVCACAAVVYTVFRPHVASARSSRSRAASEPLPANPVSLQGAIIRGDAKAQVVVIEYSDFQCPYCAAFVHNTLPAIEKAYIATGKIRFAFRNLPLTIHKFAFPAAVAAECAGEQSQFWQMHDWLFENQKALDTVSIRNSAHALGLNVDTFDKCTEGAPARKVKSEVDEAHALAVNGTPTFFIGTAGSDGLVKVTKRMSGAVPPSDFSASLDTVIANASTQSVATARD